MSRLKVHILLAWQKKPLPSNLSYFLFFIFLWPVSDILDVGVFELPHGYMAIYIYIYI